MNARVPSDVGRSTITLIAQGFSGVGLNAVFGMALARSMTAEDFGEFAAARGMLGLTAILATLGFAGLVLSALPRALHDQDHAEARGLLHFAPRVVALAGLLIAAVVIPLHWIVEHDTVLQIEHFAAMMLLLPIAGAQTVLAAQAAALGNAVRANMISRVALPLLGLLFVGAFRLVEGVPLGVFDAALIWGGALLLDLILTSRALRAVLPDPLRAGERASAGRRWLQAALPYLGATVFLVWLDIGGVIVIGWIHADAEATAIFAAAALLSALTLVPGVSTAPLYLPRLAHAIDIGDIAEARRIERERNRLVVPMTLAAAGILIVFGNPLLDLFGPGYDAGTLALRVLVVAKAVNTLYALAPSQIQFLGSNAAVRILGVFFVVSIPLMVVLGQWDSATGVAVGQGLALGAATIAVQIALHRIRKRRYPSA